MLRPIDNKTIQFSLPEPDTVAKRARDRLPGFAACDWVAQTTSTNAELLACRRQVGKHLAWPRLLGAHHQTQGRGRLGRHWLDLPGQALMFSCGFALPAKAAPSINCLGPALGISSRMAIGELLIEPESLRVKWPNDLMLKHGKVAGLLTEAVTQGEQLLIVVGMGMNLSGQSELSTALERDVAAIAPDLRAGVTVEDLICTLALTWQATIKTIEQQGFAPYHAAFIEHDYLAGREVSVLQQDQPIACGHAKGVDHLARLLVMTDHGLSSFDIGDVSVRPNLSQTTT